MLPCADTILDFRFWSLGLIFLPCSSASNCILNLSKDKGKVNPTEASLFCAIEILPVVSENKESY